MLKQNLRSQALLSKARTAVCHLAFATASLMLLFGATPGRSQSNASAASGLDAGFRSMYNLQFDQAHHAFGDWQSQHPDDPMGPVAEAAVFLFSECDRLHILEAEFQADDKKAKKSSQITPDLAVKKQFESLLEKAGTIAEARLTQNSRDTNAILARILMDGLHGDYLALVENRERDALHYLKQSRVLAESLIATDPANYDAYLPIGVENYMTGLKSAAVRWFLRAGGAQTDKAAGLKNLKIVAEKGHYLAPFAKVFLALAALRDHDKARAIELMEALAREFPDNHLYTTQLAQLRGDTGSRVAVITSSP